MRGPKFTIGGAVPTARPLAEKCSCLYVALSKGVQNFNYLSLVVSDISGGPKFTLGGAAPPARPIAEKFSSSKSTWPYLNVCKISTIYL